MASGKRSKVEEGDLISIDLADGRSFIGKVIFVSNYFRDVILLAIYRADAWQQEGALAGRQPALLIYTSSKCVGSKGWAKTGSEPVTEGERLRSQRIVGGEVWLGDEELGPAQASDWKSLPRMDVAGCKAVEEDLRALSDR